MSWWLIPFSYLLGSVSFGLLFVALLEHRDLRQFGSGNAGATNVLRVAGKAPAVATLLLDIGKGALPIWLGFRLGASSAVIGASALAVVLGHIYPIFHGFRGGKGVATAAGALGVLSPGTLLTSMLIFALVVATTRYVSLASVVGVAAYPLALAAGMWREWLVVGSWWWVLLSGVVATVVIVKHRENIARLRAGTEPRFAQGRRSR